MFVLIALGILVGSFVLLLLCVEIGRAIGQQRVAKGGTASLEGFGAVDGAVFGLLGLLLAFVFSAASSRFDMRRQLIVQEANAIGTASLRLDLLPVDRQPRLRATLRQYVATRMEAYRRWPLAAPEVVTRSAALQGDLWKQAVAGCRVADVPNATIPVVNALNEMFDLASTREAALRIHIPWLIVVLLAVLALVSSVLVGFDMGRASGRSWIHVFGFAAVLSTTIYVILDYEFPRVGLIRVDATDQVIANVQKSL